MAIRVELSLRLQNTPGALARVCKILSDEHINLLALSVEGGGLLRMVVDNHLSAIGSLRDRHYIVEQRDVLCVHVPKGPEGLGMVVRLLADADINLEYVYGSLLEEQPVTVFIVGVSDPERVSAAVGI